MEFNLGNQFSREFSFEEGRITSKLADDLNLFFTEKIMGKGFIKFMQVLFVYQKVLNHFFLLGL